MPERFIGDYINKVVLLETRAGTKTHYRLIDPLSFDPTDTIAMQKAAKTIASFVGIDRLIIVAFSKHDEKVGGHIEHVHGDRTGYIEISRDLVGFHSAIQATLAHEISHLYLDIHNVSCGSGPAHHYENEVLTDITAVFIGLGKLMLNGSDSQKVYVRHEPTGKKVITETRRMGYLTRPQFAFIYRLICAMRGIPASDYERGLSAGALAAVCECDERYHRDFFDKRFREKACSPNLVASLRSQVQETQFELASIERNISYLLRASLGLTEAFLGSTHKRLFSLSRECEEMEHSNSYDPALMFLETLQLRDRIGAHARELAKYRSEASRHERNTSGLLVRSLKLDFFDRALGPPTIVVCRNDGTKLRVKKKEKPQLVRCPECGYVFVADTTLPRTGKISAGHGDSVLKRLTRFLRRRN
jgi:hypothetical protein